MSGDFDRITIDDPERDNRINRHQFMRRLCELDKIARQNGQPTSFPLEQIWEVQKAFGQKTYSRSTIDELVVDENLVRKDENGRFSLTDKGREAYCSET